MILPASTANDTPAMTRERTRQRNIEAHYLAQCVECPMCGANSNGLELREVPPWLHGHDPQSRIVCDCGVCGPTESTIDEAVKSWNTRAARAPTWPRPFALGFVIGCLSSIAAAILFILFTL